MKKIVLAVIMFMLCAPAFAMQKKKKAKVIIAGIQSVTINRTACYGRCPVYSITIDNKGMITYEGKMNVPDTGVFTKKIGTAETKKLIDKLTSCKVDTCKARYENLTVDLPGLNYTIVFHKKSIKEIRNANWGPSFLKEVATEMDALGKEHDATWKKVK